MTQNGKSTPSSKSDWIFGGVNPSVLSLPSLEVTSSTKDELHVGLDVPKQAATEINQWAHEQKWPEGTELEPIEDYHITMLFVEGEGAADHLDADWIHHDRHAVTVKGIKEFPPSEEKDGLHPIVLLIEGETLQSHHDELVDGAEGEGLDAGPYSREEYLPHITIAYGPSLPGGVHPPTITFETAESSVSEPRDDEETKSSEQYQERHKNDGILTRVADAPTKPPNLREGSSESHCGNCTMYWRNKGGKGGCWGYNNYDVEATEVCDSWDKGEDQVKYSKTSAYGMPTGFDPEEHNCSGVADLLLEQHPELTYQEGWTRLRPKDQWGAHAWTVDPQGNVVDPFAEHEGWKGLEYLPAHEVHEDATPWDSYPHHWAKIAAREWICPNCNQGEWENEDNAKSEMRCPTCNYSMYPITKPDVHQTLDPRELPEGGLWHMAPTEDRARIQQHGLIPSKPEFHPRWKDSIGIRKQPEGVYGVPDEQKAETWGDLGKSDLWFIPHEQIKEMSSDSMANAFIVHHRVDPQLRAKAEELWDWPRSKGIMKPPPGPYAEELVKFAAEYEASDSWHTRDKWPDPISDLGADPERRTDAPCWCGDPHCSIHQDDKGDGEGSRTWRTVSGYEPAMYGREPRPREELERLIQEYRQMKDSLPLRMTIKALEYELSEHDWRVSGLENDHDHWVWGDDGNPYWSPPHEQLVTEALNEWRGAPTQMHIFAPKAEEPIPEQMSGNYRKWHAQVNALLKELQENPKPVPKLYRGSHYPPKGLESWSEDPDVAHDFAQKGGGQIYELEPGSAHGLRMADYTRDHEAQWLVDHRSHGRSASVIDGMWRISADEFDTREYQDSRMLAPNLPNEKPVATEGPNGTYEGCSCKQGDKLHCPIHGMNPTVPDPGLEWSIAEGSPVGWHQINYTKGGHEAAVWDLPVDALNWLKAQIAQGNQMSQQDLDAFMERRNRLPAAPFGQGGAWEGQPAVVQKSQPHLL